MQFFEPPPRSGQRDEPKMPDWFGPPADELGVGLPLRTLLARSDRCALALAGLVAYSTGFELGLNMRLRDVDPWIDPFGNRQGPPWERYGSGPLPDDLFRIGLQLADGTKATSLDRPTMPDQPAPRARLQLSGGGGGRRWDFHIWMWPVLRDPPNFLVLEWPALGIEQTRFELPTDELKAACQLSSSIWT